MAEATLLEGSFREWTKNIKEGPNGYINNGVNLRHMKTNFKKVLERKNESGDYVQ